MHTTTCMQMNVYNVCMRIARVVLGGAWHDMGVESIRICMIYVLLCHAIGNLLLMRG